VIDRLSTRIIVYTTSLVLFVLMIFSVSSIITIMSLRNYSLKKVEKIFKENADENLQKEVISYAKILKGDMNAKKSVSFMFGEVIDKNISPNHEKTLDFVRDIYGEINNVLDLRDIAIFNYRGKKILQYPDFEDVTLLSEFVKKLVNKPVSQKIFYYDFHENRDGSVSFSFVYTGKSRNRSPLYIAFDYNPYNFYTLVKTAQLYPYSQKYLWVINKRGLLIYEPPTKEHSLITLSNRIDLTNPENGQALANIVRSEILKGRTGVAKYTFRGVEEFVGFTYVKEFGWGLGLTLPTEVFYKPINALNMDINAKTIFTLALFGLFSSIVVLIAISTSILLSRRIINPINRTAEAIESILKGDYSIRLPKSGIVDLDKLADAVNRLMDYFSKK